MYLNEAYKEQQKWTFELTTKTVVLLIIFLLSLAFCFIKYDSIKKEESETAAIIANPEVNDLYFLDFRLLSDNLRPKEKYRIAKVVDITGDIVTLLYGAFYYQHQNAAINSIKYGQLRYKEYFETKRYDIPLSQIKSMYTNQAIYLAQRPIRNKLDGNLVFPEKTRLESSYLTYGKKENSKGEAFLVTKYSETNLLTAFEFFQESAMLGYPKGQVNLAEMYINGHHVDQDFIKALYWLKKSSLQSYKPAILKYGIICKKVTSCNIAEFYRELVDSGVNIKVRALEVKLDS